MTGWLVILGLFVLLVLFNVWDEKRSHYDKEDDIDAKTDNHFLANFSQWVGRKK